MSLINQMLQDLEKRQPGVLTSVPPPVLKAAPWPPRRLHLAWWAVPMLATMIGVFVWLALRSPARQVVVAPLPAVAPVQTAQTRSIPPSPVNPIVSLPLTNHAAPAPVPESITSPPAEKMAVVNTPPAAAALPEKTPLAALPEKTNHPTVALHEAEVTTADTTPSRANVEKAKMPSPTYADKPRASLQPVERAAAAGAITKQLKEVTPQQQAENTYRKAVVMVQQGRIPEATEELTHALQLDPRHAGARQTLVGLLLDANRYGDAERKLQEGLAIAPEQPDLIMILARLQVERGDTRGGLASLERGLPYAAENAPYQAFLAALLQREGRHRQAIEHYLLALRNAPQTGVWLMGLGISLQADNRLPEAREAFSRARTSNTLSPELQAFVEQRLKQLGS